MSVGAFLLRLQLCNANKNHFLRVKIHFNESSNLSRWIGYQAL